MKVQGCLMQAHLIEIHQVFTKIRSDTYLTKWYLSHTIILINFPLNKEICYTQCYGDVLLIQIESNLYSKLV